MQTDSAVTGYSAPDSDGIRWKDATSDNGDAIRVGYRPTVDESESIEEEAVDVMSKINWTVGQNVWRSPSGTDVGGIYRYKIYALPQKDTYRVGYTNKTGTKFAFTDAKGSIYISTANPPGDHYFDVYSPKDKLVIKDVVKKA